MLLVEDQDEKARSIRTEIEKRLPGLEIHFTRATDYESALETLRNNIFDFAIIDILIPSLDQEPSPDASRALIQRILDGSTPHPPYMFGLTQYEEVMSEQNSFFKENLLNIEKFSFTDFEWADRISKNIFYLSKCMRVAGFNSSGDFNYDVAILVSRYESEFVPIKSAIPWDGSPENSHPLFPNNNTCIGNVLLDTNLSVKVGLFCLETMGVASAASLATQVALFCKPRVISMLGMCCGFKMGIDPSFLNDVIIVKECDLWDEGKYDKNYERAKFKYRPETIQSSRKIRTFVTNYVATSATAFAKKLGKRAAHKKIKANEEFSDEVQSHPKVKLGKLVSGLNVISDEEKIELVLDRVPNAIGLEMEIYGVYKAVSSIHVFSPEFLAIKGVADFGHNKDDRNYDMVQPIASQHSLYVLLDLLKSYFMEDGTYSS